jgi:hypothetical protein
MSKEETRLLAELRDEASAQAQSDAPTAQDGSTPE